MSVGHRDHVLTVYSSMEQVTWKSPGHVLHGALSSQYVIKMSDGHRNIETLSLGNVLQLCSF